MPCSESIDLSKLQRMPCTCPRSTFCQNSHEQTHHADGKRRPACIHALVHALVRTPLQYQAVNLLVVHMHMQSLHAIGGHGCGDARLELYDELANALPGILTAQLAIEGCPVQGPLPVRQLTAEAGSIQPSCTPTAA